MKILKWSTSCGIYSVVDGGGELNHGKIPGYETDLCNDSREF
jgi:hypothetical protein